MCVKHEITNLIMLIKTIKIKFVNIIRTINIYVFILAINNSYNCWDLSFGVFIVFIHNSNKESTKTEMNIG